MIRQFLIFMITLYQKGFSFLLGPKCRFYPSCSDYAKESIQKKGIARGLFKSTVRILKCHPYHPGGFDPVK